MQQLSLERNSEERTGNKAKRRLLVKPYGPEIKSGFCCFYESPPDRYVPNSSPAEMITTIYSETLFDGINSLHFEN